MAGHIATAGRSDWTTPKLIVETVREVFGGTIALDPCSNERSIVHATREYLLPKDDGLVDSWDFHTIFVNPPYGRCYMHKVTKEFLDSKDYRLLSKEQKKEYKTSTVADWCTRAYKAYAEGSEVIMLIPAAVDTKHWQQNILRTASMVNFLRGRVHFDGAGPAPMATALVYWGVHSELFSENTFKLGSPVDLTGNVYYVLPDLATPCINCNVREGKSDKFCSYACKVTHKQ